MTDKANTEHLDLFHESLLAALDTNLPAKLKQTMQGLEADATAVRSGSLSGERARANLHYYNFVAEAQRQFMRYRPAPQVAADAILREVIKYAETHSLDDVTSVECKSTAMKLFFKFQQWQRAERRQS